MKKILIVDDEKNIRTSIEKCLGSSGYILVIACDGEEAIEKIKSEKFDLILMDYQIPRKDGIEVLKEIRKENIFTKVIMMTAFGTVDIAVKTMKLGAVDFISKPFTVKEIKNLVKDNLKKETRVLTIDKSAIEYIKEAREAILEEEYEKARLLLKEALVMDTSSPIIQNLIGVVEERENKILLAQKYYRAALSLDATYLPADNNLMRTAMFSSKSTKIDLG